MTSTVNGGAPPAGVPDAGWEAAELRRLMLCRGEAAERHRTAAGRMLGLDRTEAAALAALSTVQTLTPAALGDRLLLSSGAITALIARLEDRGAAERHPHPHDRRSILISATRQHLNATATVYAPLIADLDELIARLSPATRAEALVFLPQATRLLRRRSDALLIEATGLQLAAAAPLTPGPWA